MDSRETEVEVEAEKRLPRSLKHEERVDVRELGRELSEGSGEEIGDGGTGMLTGNWALVGVGEIIEVFEIMAKSSSVSESSSEAMSC
jgi:hypothetical protein